MPAYTAHIYVRINLFTHGHAETHQTQTQARARTHPHTYPHDTCILRANAHKCRSVLFEGVVTKYYSFVYCLYM